MMDSYSRRLALGQFLRKHRERMAPEAHQQSFRRRRRTPGLRREEVAGLAGISTSWYARLEQAEETAAPSAAALDRIATVLRLTAPERAYLFHLSGRIDLNYVADLEDKSVLSAIESFVLGISSPAYLLDKYWTPLLLNGEAARLFAIWLEGPEINLLRHMFLDPKARAFVVDWELRARQLVAQFRLDFGNAVDDPKMLGLVGGLTEGSDVFRSMWSDQRVLFRNGSDKAYNHPDFGLLKFHQTTYLVAGQPSLKLIVATPEAKEPVGE